MGWRGGGWIEQTQETQGFHPGDPWLRYVVILSQNMMFVPNLIQVVLLPKPKLYVI